MASDDKRPSHRVYTVIKKHEKDENPFWLNIGSAWEHADEKGFNIQLQASPLDGRLVLRELKEDEPEEKAPPVKGKK